MPDCTPGSLLQDHARYVSKIACATRAGMPISIEHVSATQWGIHLKTAERLTVNYDVYPNTKDALRLTTNSSIKLSSPGSLVVFHQQVVSAGGESPVTAALMRAYL